MSNRPDLLGPFLLTVSLAAVALVFTLLYLLFGDAVQTPFSAQAEAPSRPTRYRTPYPNGDGEDEVVNGIHVASGLVYAEGFDLVRGNCTACHSAKLVTQNRATREGWRDMIRWMQAKQGLWDLGENEPAILNYLAAHYAPEETGRRANLDVEDIEWYVLELED